MPAKKSFIKSHIIAILVVLVIVGIGMNIMYFVRSPYPVVSMIRNSAFPVNEDEKNKDYIFNGGNQAKVNLNYPSQYINNTYDIYLPKKAKKNHPVIIWTHGGGFVGGDKTNIREYGETLCNQGYTFISINYELAPEAAYPTPIIQLSQFMSYMQDKNPHQINLNNLFFAGDSAGAQISAQFLTIQANAKYAQLTGIDPVIDINQVHGVLLYSGVYDIKAMSNSGIQAVDYIYDNIAWAYLGSANWRESKQAKEVDFLPYINQNYPPVFITDGNVATFTDQAKSFIKILENHQVKVQSLFFPPGELVMHVYHFNMQSQQGKQAYQETIKFLKNYNE